LLDDVLVQDVSQIVDLLEVVFNQNLRHSQPQQHLNPSLGQLPFPFNLWQSDRPVPGFVWERDRRIVGNVSLLTTQVPDRYLIANVAVYPELRRQGIAQRLMVATMDWVKNHHGRELFLQVEINNHGARRLYDNLGFQPLDTATSWVMPYERIPGLRFPVYSTGPDRYPGFYLRPLRGADWQQAYQIESTAFMPDLHCHDPISPTHYQSAWWQWWVRLLNNNQQEVWLAVDETTDKPIGLAAIVNEWGQAYQLKVRVLPEYHGRVERALLGKLLRRLKQYARRRLKIEQRTDDDVMNDLLHEVGFTVRRSLTTMQYPLNPPLGRGATPL
jgi:ribosomal protein S18 acetylase RimI-like enzyme